jgi:hypothetical protein
MHAALCSWAGYADDSRRARGNELRGLAEFTFLGITTYDMIIIPPSLLRPQTTPSTRPALRDTRISLELEVRRVDCTVCGKVKQKRLDWKTVKELDKQYMGEQLRSVGTPAPEVIGIDEISIRKGHSGLQGGGYRSRPFFLRCLIKF